MIRKRYLIPFLFILMLFASWWIGEGAYHEWMNEQDSFQQLGNIARMMMSSRSPGVSDDGTYIVSPTAFVVFARTHLATGVPNDNNPFPAILKNGPYKFRATPTTNPMDIILQGCRIYRRPVGDLHVILRANGLVQSVP